MCSIGSNLEKSIAGMGATSTGMGLGGGAIGNSVLTGARRVFGDRRRASVLGGDVGGGNRGGGGGSGGNPDRRPPIDVQIP